jgi:hypothetical protein
MEAVVTSTEFEKAIKEHIQPGLILKNPGDGTSTIKGYTDNKVSYLRGNSTIYVALDDLYKAYSRFRGQRVTSSDLRTFAPHVFDSNARPAGHSCNCTFLFLILGRLNLAGQIEGRGISGDPFAVEIYE